MRHFFDNPIEIRNSDKFESLLQLLNQFDGVEKARQALPKSKWSVLDLTNIGFFMYILPDVPIGNIIGKNRDCKELSLDDLDEEGANHNITIPAKYNDRQPGMLHLSNQTDNLFCFYCLHASGLLSGQLIKDQAILRDQKLHVQALAREYFLSTPNDKSLQDYKGVTFNKLDELERFFKISVTVYERRIHCLTERQVCYLVRHGFHKYKDKTLILDLWDMHFSLITNINWFSNFLACPNCNAHWDRHDNFIRHFVNCTGTQREVFYNGDFDSQKNNFVCPT